MPLRRVAFFCEASYTARTQTHSGAGPAIKTG